MRAIDLEPYDTELLVERAEIYGKLGLHIECMTDCVNAKQNFESKPDPPLEIRYRIT